MIKESLEKLNPLDILEKNKFKFKKIE